MLPSVTVTKLDGNTGVAAPSVKGICAIIAPSQSGAAGVQAVAKAGLALASYGYGVLTEYGAHMIAATKKPALLVKTAASTSATYGAIAFTGTGTSVATAGVTSPVDDFDVVITIVNGGTRGVAGITYTYSLDGGQTVSPLQALGTASSITIPNSGVQIALAAGTLVAGDVIKVSVVGPRLTTADISVALEALRVSRQPWEVLLIGGHDATQATVDLLDAWLAAREAEGKFRAFIVGARMKNAGETEAAYATAMTTVWSATASIRGCVAADGGDVISAVPGRGLIQRRSTALALAMRLMASDYGLDAAYVASGPLPGFGLADVQGNPKNHDEALYPGLDALRLVTLRSVETKNGTFITNPVTIATAGSDFVYAQHIRTMNRACELAYGALTNQLSRGVAPNPTPGPSGQVYISEQDALRIEQLANAPLNELRGQVADLNFGLSRTDDIGSNGPAFLTGDVQIVSLRYVKGIAVNASFTRSISVQQ